VAFHGASLDARFSSRAHHETRYEMVSLFRPLPLLLIPLDRHPAAPDPRPYLAPTSSCLFLTIPSVLSSILSPSAFFLPSRDRDARYPLAPPRRGTSRSARDLLDELINRPPRRISASRARAGAFAEIEPAIAIYCRAGKIHGSAEARGAIAFGGLGKGSGFLRRFRAKFRNSPPPSREPPDSARGVLHRSLECKVNEALSLIPFARSRRRLSRNSRDVALTV